MMRMHGAFALLLLGVSGAAGTNTHYDSTRMWSHSNVNYGSQAAHMGDPGTRGFKDPAQELLPKVKGDTQRAASGATLVQSITTVGEDGWSTAKANGNPSSVHLGADIGKGVVGSDTNGDSWYFLAPGDKFAGDLSQAYNGQLSLTLVHAETPSGGSVKREPDVILEASCGHSLMLYNFASKSGDLSVMLNEDAGWIDSRTKSAPGAMDFLGVLSHLSAVKVRGGYYAGAESTRLSSVSITAGKAWYPCCTLDGTVDLCQKKPSSYYNPEGLKFYCEGHMYKPVKVTRVTPRFGRRTGGSIVTVTGENFGLSGSSPIVRINGRACQRTYYAPSVVHDHSEYELYSSVANMYALTGTGDSVVGASSPAGNALINAYNSATDSMKQQYPEHCWNGMQDDGSDKGFNYGTAASAKYINQGETGIDTGGPCFPEHCSSCPVPSANSANLKNLGSNARCSAGNQIAAVSSGTCKGRGSDVALCAFNFPYLKYPALCPEDAPYSSRLKKAYTAVHYSTAAGFGWAAMNEWADIRRDYGHRRWNKYGMFANVNSKHEAVEGVSRITHANPQMAATAFGKATVRAGSFIVDNGDSLTVDGACEVLFGKGVTTSTGLTYDVACGSDPVMRVTAIADRDDDGDGVFDFCALTITAATAGATPGELGANAPGTAGKAETTCQAGSTVSLSGTAVPSFASTSKVVNVEDAVGLCGLNFKPLGTAETDANDYTVDTDDLEDRVQGVTTAAAAYDQAAAATVLDVKSVYDLLGAETTGVVECGGTIFTVSAATRPDEANPNRLTVADVGAAAAAVTKCHTGATVKRLWSITMKTDFTDKEDEYFHPLGAVGESDLDSFGTPTFDNPAYVMLYDKTAGGEINGEIVKVVGVAQPKLIVAERGSFGSPIIKHAAALTKQAVAVEVCRGAAISIGPAAATGGNRFTAAVSANAECQGYDGPTTTDGRHCRLRVATSAELLNTVRVGDVTRRVAQGRTTCTTNFKDADPSLVVADAAALMAVQAVQKPGLGELVDANFFVSCGGDTTLQVTAVNYATNTLTVTGATANALGGTAGDPGACNAGDVVTVVRGVAELDADAAAAEIVIKGRCEYLLGGPPVKQTPDGAAVNLDITSRAITLTCGSLATKTIITVTHVKQYVLATDKCTLTVTTDTTGGDCTTAGGKYIYNAAFGTFPAHQEYTTTFDVLSKAELATSDAAEFSRYRYIKVDNEIMRILDLADGDTAEATGGYERLTVARAQLGTHAAAHDRDAVVTLLPRMTELSQAVAKDAATLYFPSQADLISNNVNVGQEVAAENPSAGRQIGGTITAYYIKVDDEIMKVTMSRAVGMLAAADGATLTVLRAQKGTLATAHAAGATVYVLGCMDGDETGSNCGGSCKPCSAPAKGGPVQQEKLICVTPAGDSGAGPSGQAAGDLSVTVEASPGPRESPFRARMAPGLTGWLDQAASAVSCISEQNRGFQYGAHDFVWGVHFASATQAEEVKVLDMAVDHNTGETYMVGTMMGTITLQGKHIAMNKKMLGKLTVEPNTATRTYLAGTAGASPGNTDKIQIATVIQDTEMVGATVITTASGGTVGAQCKGTVLSSLNANNELTLDGFKRTKDADCADFADAPLYRVYNGKLSFIAKFSKDGRPVWLNKVDAESTVADVMGQVEISSISVDPAAGTHYVVGTYSDGLVATAPAAVAERIKLNIYSVGAATRTAPKDAPATSIQTVAPDTYGQQNTAAGLVEGVKYQEGFMIKYSSAGQYLSSEFIKGVAAAQQLVVENLKVRSFKASTSNVINTQMPKDGPAPTEPTHTSRNEVEYDRGVAVSATQGGGTEERSTIVLATSAATYFQGAGQDLAAVGTLMDDWYNGLTITITCGKGMGQSRKIQDYSAATRTAYVQPHWSGNGEMTPDATSCYTISGKPSSHVHGEHWANGGIYVTGRLVNVPAAAGTVCFGQMPDVYRDSGAAATGIPVCAQFAGLVANEELNFIAQYDNSLRTFWVRFLYDGDKATTMAGAGDITAVTTMDDMVFVTGTYGYHASATSNVVLRLQNCTFDSATVAQAPPANTEPTVTTLKKLCRTQAVVRTANTAINQLLPGETVQKLESGSDTFVGVVANGNSDYIVENTVAEDYVDVGTAAFAADPTKGLMFTAAYDGSGRLVWYHYTGHHGKNDATVAADLLIQPTAMTHVVPAIGNKPLSGYWKTLSDTERRWTSRGQPGDATAAKDVASERVDSATVKGGFIYIVGTIKSNADDQYADFGVTKYPLECSNGKTLGQKGQDLRKLDVAPCAGKLQSRKGAGNANTDVFLVKLAARGAPRSDWASSEYGTANIQPAVQWIRRTGLEDFDDAATGVAVHDLTGAVFVTGTYKASLATKYQGSDLGEKRYLAATGNDGGNTYVATPSAAGLLNQGDDVFGLQAAGRVNAIGCPMQRAAPAGEHEERLGLTGVPDCTFYSHAKSAATTTGFVVKFNDNGDETQRGNKNSKFQKSITGFVTTSVATFATSIAPCPAGGGDRNTHVLTGADNCATSPRGCSCLLLTPTSKTAGVFDTTAASGMRVRITSGKAAGYEGIISAYEDTAQGTDPKAYAFFTIPALPEMPDEHSQFVLQPWNNLQPNIHLQTCTATSGMGCAAYGVEWAKTIGWPVGQAKVTPNNPTNVEAGVKGRWTAVGTGGGTATTATNLELAVADEVTTTTYYNGYWVELTTQTAAQVALAGTKAEAVARVTLYAVSDNAGNGGHLTIACPDIPAGCPVATYYRLIAKTAATTGVADLPSEGTRQQSVPQSVMMMDSDVYIGGWFKGFDRFRFGIEGVDETVGYRSVGDDTWETYLVKLSD